MLWLRNNALRLSLSAACLCMAVLVNYLTEYAVRLLGLFLLGYTLHGFLHSTLMLADYRKISKSWEDIAEHRKKLEQLEHRLMSGQQGEPS